jgi:hypothetical protein
MSFVSQSQVMEIQFSLENLVPQRVHVSSLNRETIGRTGYGLYLFYRDSPPHFLYLGLSEDIVKRIIQQRRLRQNYSYVLIYRLRGYVEFEILKELEIRALRQAWKRWPWAKWSNERSLWVKGHDAYSHSANPAMSMLLQSIFCNAEGCIESSRHFDPTPTRQTRVTHHIGSEREDSFAIASASGRGITILKGSRLPKSIKRRSDIDGRLSRSMDKAVSLWRLGILDRWRWTVKRDDGIYFTQDYRCKSRAEAASIISLSDRPATDWKAHKG